jgi:hypothetical protein
MNELENPLNQQKNPQREVNPHREKHQHSRERCYGAPPGVDRRCENAGLGEARHHEYQESSTMTRSACRSGSASAIKT